MLKDKLLLSLFFTFVLSELQAQEKRKHPPFIPEPMVFDLVRPLGAARSELEFNTLVVSPLSRKNYAVNYAPEVEWAFTDGHSIEFELPMQNGIVKAYKIALQGTISYNKEATFIQGWQWISEFATKSNRVENTLLYLSGFKLKNGFTIFSMLGGRYNTQTKVNPEIASRSRWDYITNLSVSKVLRNSSILSVETNYAWHTGEGHDLRIIPQVHHRLSHSVNLQAGVGYEWYMGENKPIASCRLIKEFH
jgi:hypothetical protein